MNLVSTSGELFCTSENLKITRNQTLRAKRTAREREQMQVARTESTCQHMTASSKCDYCKNKVNVSKDKTLHRIIKYVI